MSALERIQQEVEQWFLTEPLFFTVYCSHRLTINPNMLCALRSGQGRIEYNPELIDSMPDHQLGDDSHSAEASLLPSAAGLSWHSSEDGERHGHCAGL